MSKPIRIGVEVQGTTLTVTPSGKSSLGSQARTELDDSSPPANRKSLPPLLSRAGIPSNGSHWSAMSWASPNEPQVLVAPLLPKVSHPRQIPPISKYQSLPQRLDPWSRRHSFIRNEVLLLNLAILWKVRLQRELRISKSLLVHTLRMLGRAWITMPCLIPAPWFKYYRRVWYCILIRHKQRYREPLDRTGQNSSWMWSDASTVAGSARAIVSFVLYYSRQLFGEID